MDLTGRTLLHYRIEEKIGEGGMGVVYKAWDTHLNRFVAIKALPPEKMADPQRKLRFMQEAKAASALNHPNIITIHDITQQEGIDFMVMEYVAGKTLDESIGRKGMRLGEMLKYSIQIADALARAHGAGIVHRDLKPSNVMVDEHGLLKVLDFGLAKLTETGMSDDSRPTQVQPPHTEEGVILGTVAYMSPEQAEGRAVDARSDIFSFGSLLYEMASGRRAFSGESRLSMLAAILREDPKPLEGLPADLGKLIARCLRKDPAKRLQHMDDVKVALEDLKEESDSGKLLPEPPVKPKQRRRLLPVAAAAAALLAFLIAAGWLFLKYSNPKTPPPTLVQLTSFPGSEVEPSFSPDGKWLAVAQLISSQKVGDRRGISLVPVDGGEPRLLSNPKAPAFDGDPSFSPDGRSLAYAACMSSYSCDLVIQQLNST